MILPISLATSVRASYQSDTLICDECQAIPNLRSEKIVKQKYECSSCGKTFNSIGMLKKRYNWENEQLYDTDAKRDFLEIEIDKEVVVLKEVLLTEAVEQDIEILNAFHTLEVFCNDSDKYIATIQAIWSYLRTNKMTLQVEAKYRGDNFLGYIIATTTGKLVLAKLDEQKNIKTPYQKDNPPITATLYDFISLKKQKEQEFFECLKTGEMPMPVQKEVIKPIICENFFR